MKRYLKKLPKEYQQLLSLAGRLALRSNMRAYLVGGIVRDLILGVNNLDLDIVIEGDGIAFAQQLARKLDKKVISHRRFGTATIVIGAHLKIDIATARFESYPHPGSLPQVTPGLLRDDLMRRDFTINAMAINITGREFGEIIDLFGGRRDLGRKVIRILHDQSFIDDPTRILRAIRFQQRYNFRIEPHSLRLLKAAAKMKMLEGVQPHRTRDELILLLKEDTPVGLIRRLNKLLGFNFLSRRLCLSRRDFLLIKSAASGIAWFRRELHYRRQLDQWLIYLMAILDSVKTFRVKSICARYAFARGDTKRLIEYKKYASVFSKKLSKKHIEPAQIFKVLEPLSYEILVMIKARYKNRFLRKHISDFFSVYNGTRLHLAGDDLKRLGSVPGPHYKKLLTRVLCAKLNGLISTKSEELAFLARLLKKK